jgi:hypothetical protein
VQIALDALALGVGGGDDALPGVVQVVDAFAQGARTSRFSGLARETDWLHLTFSLVPGSRRRLLAPVLTPLSSSSCPDLTGGVLNTVREVVRNLADDGRVRRPYLGVSTAERGLRRRRGDPSGGARPRRAP